MEPNPERGTTMPEPQQISRKHRWKVQGRVAVLEYASAHGLKPAAERFGLDRKTVREWRDRAKAGGEVGLVPRYPKRRPRRRSDARSARATASASDISPRASTTPGGPPRRAVFARGPPATRRRPLEPPARSAGRAVPRASAPPRRAPPAPGWSAAGRPRSRAPAPPRSATGPRSATAPRRRATPPAGSAGAAGHPRAPQRPHAG